MTYNYFAHKIVGPFRTLSPIGIALICLAPFGCGSSKNDEENLSVSCSVNGSTAGFSYCVDFESVSKNLGESACSDAYQGHFNESGLCTVEAGTLGCLNVDEESGIKTTIWLTGSDWPDSAEEGLSLCNGKEMTQKE